MGVVIMGRVAYMVEKDTHGALEYRGGYYLWEADYNRLYWDLMEGRRA